MRRVASDVGGVTTRAPETRIMLHTQAKVACVQAAGSRRLDVISRRACRRLDDSRLARLTPATHLAAARRHVWTFHSQDVREPAWPHRPPAGAAVSRVPCTGMRRSGARASPQTHARRDDAPDAASPWAGSAHAVRGARRVTGSAHVTVRHASAGAWSRPMAASHRPDRARRGARVRRPQHDGHRARSAACAAFLGDQRSRDPRRVPRAGAQSRGDAA